ncbi:MAG: PrsW family intramembrane metalloprotease [Treponema sp.]|jgi:RsiW-degrading membrane proteinase PrsW (M82 family)|nr:PrsW family intramembrane metalloprotease [Treponema sp.]
MEGLWVLFLLIFFAALPALLVYLWVRSGKFPLSALWFLLSLLAGALALGIAALLQNLVFPLEGMIKAREGIGLLAFHIFIRIALTEETGRLAALFLLFYLGGRFLGRIEPGSPEPGKIKPEGVPYAPDVGAAAGLAAGLGFALIESAVYGAVNMGITLLRAVTAAPLHGACGARVGIAVTIGNRKPVHALCRFLSAVAIHGMYNFMVISPGLPAIVLALLISFTALASSIQVIRAGAGGVKPLR